MREIDYDAVVIGGGFYGACIALYLKENGLNPLIVEAADSLLSRASYVNQARVHNGYHYPRSFMTAWRSFANFPQFVLDFRGAVDNSFEKIYAIARQNSKVTAAQFDGFCRRIGLPIRPAPRPIARLFDDYLIESAFVVKEYAFDAVKLRDLMAERLQRAHVETRLKALVTGMTQHDDGTLSVQINGSDTLHTRYVFNCTYAMVNTVLKQAGAALMALKHEVTEIALCDVPEAFKALGITVMDGPFFSVMPFPAQGLHSFSHVRYTPHESWADLVDGFRNPYDYLRRRENVSQFVYMLRDAQRYIPDLAPTRYVRSLFEVKTVLLRNETDDGRPILFHQTPEIPHLYSIMGGKIDNIYDILKHIRKFISVLPQGVE